MFTQNSWREHLGMETSLEECILQELERVMAQLTDTTRICFRDALYRLAENSKQHEDDQKQIPEILGCPSSLMDHDETTRLDTNESESVTNPIDRAVAFLMFNYMDFSAQDSPASAPATVNEVSGTAGASSYSVDESDISHFPYSARLEADNEVPVFNRKDSHSENRSTDRFLKHHARHALKY